MLVRGAGAGGGGPEGGGQGRGVFLPDKMMERGMPSLNVWILGFFSLKLGYNWKFWG